ncbi:hypothetical protein [Streptomyces sp. NPDC017988]|uniref:hypothetical protein n=1 Tax=Streptomyces sp. NPDC017988 TaxID=3365025 RepID=UPI0037A1B871
MATGYVPGPDPHAVVGEQHGPLPEESVRALAHGLAQALRAIHDAGLIHPHGACSAFGASSKCLRCTANLSFLVS